ncbi:MAG TPA: HlyD family efflux transporter periplasmic adaptor subunit [Deltaproteobacteria bacterium]|jgi:HlyD family secretion protein|nr:HlyD family efflux transporter periplasmic adaptor subunit [Deltaproteobacteria bacterium]
MADKGRFIKRAVLFAVLVVLIGALGFKLFYSKDKSTIPEGFAMGNGRLEATEVDIAAGIPGRLYEVTVREGDLVKENQILARMDISTLQAMLKQAEAEVMRAKGARRTAIAKVQEVRNRVVFAEKEFARSRNLFSRGISTQQQYDRDETQKEISNAEYAGLVSRVAECEAAIASASAQVDRLKTEIDDCILRTYCNGRVQARLAEPGEVLPAGGKVLTVIDMGDMYMNIFLPEKVAGMVAIGAEARVVTDAFPDRPLHAKVSFVSEKAQFTPKEVEATEERQKLVFRVKVRIEGIADPTLKPGMPGVAYIRLDPSAKWPDNLK